MPLHLEEAVQADVPALVDCLFAAYSDPYHPFVDIVFPGAGRNAPEGKKPAADRFLASWKTNPYEKWVKVLDSETGQIVGTSRWAVYTENPFPKGPPHVEATWQPEGSLIREYLTFLVNDRLERQAARCSKANVYLGTMGVRPSHRRQGASTMMVQWGVDRAKELDLEMFVEASWYGSQVYQRFGFRYVDEFRFKRPPEKEGDVGWDELEKKHPFEGLWFWRPRDSAATASKT